jgi:hypothetical protein
MEGGAEGDTNVKQTESIAGEANERIAAPVARAGARIDHRDTLLGGTYVLGLSGLARVVADTRARAENVVLYAGDARWVHGLDGRPIAIGARLTYADAVGIAGEIGSRSFRYGGGDAVLVLGGGDDRHLTLAIGERALTYKPPPTFTWHGPVVNARLDLGLWQSQGKTRSLDLATTLGFEARTYDRMALRDDCPSDAPPAQECSALTTLIRRDRFQRAGLELDWTSSVVVTVGYQLTAIDSNSYGQSLFRHRMTASATTELFDKLFATVSATLQIDQYPDGVLVEKAALQEVTTIEDENRSSLQIRLARELTATWSLEARGAVWREFGNAETAAFRRELFYTGVIYAR